MIKLINRSNEFKPSVTLNGETKSGFAWLLEFYPELTQARGARIAFVTISPPPGCESGYAQKRIGNNLAVFGSSFPAVICCNSSASGASGEQIAAEVLRDPALYIRQKPSQATTAGIE